MSITAAAVLFVAVWFLTFFIVLPIRLTTQAEAGAVVPGTPRSAPAGFVVKRKALITTGVAILVWFVLYIIITQGWITVRDFDVMGRMPPLSE
jgi:predicted secreted protein